MHPRRTLAIGNFFAVAHFYLIIYILTPYLATFMPEEYTGLVVSAGALATLALFPYAPRMVTRVGARRLALVFGTAEALALLGLAVAPLPVVALILAAIACALPPIIAYGLDLLLEATVAHEEEGTTGRVRTAFLTAGNAALIIAPVVIALTLDSTDAYERIFLIAAASLLPLLALFVLNPIPEGGVPDTTRPIDGFKMALRDRDLRSVIAAYFLLQFFYYSSPLYVSLFLHIGLGISWSILGWVLAAILVPFLAIEYPAGVAADRWLGDKGLMVAGFVIAGGASVAFALVTGDTPLLFIVAILMATRVGVALVESMTEGHFFRRVTERDAESVSLFRMARPMAALVAPIVCSVLLAAGGYTTLFLGIGVIVGVFGILAAASIVDKPRRA
jgi:MFS family permease